jgi:hypothetical protein
MILTSGRSLTLIRNRDNATRQAIGKLLKSFTQLDRS